MKEKKVRKSGVRKFNRREFIVSAYVASAGMVSLKPGRSGAGIAGQTRIRLDYHNPSHNIPKSIYGHFIEELGKCIIGGIWRPVKGEDQFLGGVPWDLVEAIKKINPSIIRYPGGCYADSYHWQDGIGPRDKRPVRKNRAWGMWGKEVGPDDSNQFGTDEFIMFCREVKAEPMITVNVGTGTPEESANWVEYCNGSPDSKWGSVRKENGHREPFDVIYWCVGNEMWNIIDGGFTAERYGKVYLDFARAMRKVDPRIKLILSGFTDKPNLWNKKVLEIAGEETDYLSIHSYGPSKITDLDGRLKKKFGYKSIFKVLDSFEKNLKLGISAIEEKGPKDREIKVCFDEWNLWYEFLDIIQTNYNLRDGLFVACMLNRLQRMADWVPIANLAQLVNCIGIIISDERGTFLTPSAWVFHLYTNYALERYLAPDVSGENSSLEVSANRDEKGERLSIFIVNKERVHKINAEINLTGFIPEKEAEIATLWHRNVMRYNSFENPDEVKPEVKKIILAPQRQGENVKFSLELPSHSVSVLSLRRMR